MAVSPDNGEGGRMSYIGLDDTLAGIVVTFYDVPNPNGNYVAVRPRTPLTRDDPHTIQFWIKLIPWPE